MLDRDQYLQSFAREVDLCKHLATKVTRLDYSPGENMRNTLDLMRYLTICGSGPADAVIHQDWSVIGRYQEEASEMSADAFPQRMDAQLAKMRELIGEVNDDDFLTQDVPYPWGGTAKLGAALIETSLKFMAAYRLQLFDHAKAAGASEMSTYNAWLGADAPPSP